MVASRDYFEHIKPKLKTLLVTASISGQGEEAFHDFMRTVSFHTGCAFAWCRPSDEN